MTEADILDALEYIRSVFPVDYVFNYLVDNGATGSEAHTIRGDDLAGACWHLANLLKEFRSRY